MNESWVPVARFENIYEVSTDGTVRSITRRDALNRVWESVVRRPQLDTRGYHSMFLTGNGLREFRTVQSIVLESFVGPRPDGMVICHYDDNKLNNRLENLRYDSPTANRLDAVRNGRDYWTARSHCKNGHEFTDENTRLQDDGEGRKSRHCRACNRIRAQEFRDRRAASK